MLHSGANASNEGNPEHKQSCYHFINGASSRGGGLASSKETCHHKKILQLQQKAASHNDNARSTAIITRQTVGGVKFYRNDKLTSLLECIRRVLSPGNK